MSSKHGRIRKKEDDNNKISHHHQISVLIFFPALFSIQRGEKIKFGGMYYGTSIYAYSKKKYEISSSLHSNEYDFFFISLSLPMRSTQFFLLLHSKFNMTKCAHCNVLVSECVCVIACKIFG